MPAEHPTFILSPQTIKASAFINLSVTSPSCQATASPAQDKIFICLLPTKSVHLPACPEILQLRLESRQKGYDFQDLNECGRRERTQVLAHQKGWLFRLGLFLIKLITNIQLQQISNCQKAQLFPSKRSSSRPGCGLPSEGRASHRWLGKAQSEIQLQFALNYNIFNMELCQPKSLQEILTYKPQFVTGSRFLLLYVAVYLFPTHPQTAAILMMTTVILDYVDGIVARKYNQVSYFGEIFDWITDTSSYAVVLFWWNGLEPTLILAFFTLFSLQVLMMMVDTVSKCHGYAPKLTANKASTFILNYTMDLSQKGYRCSGLGYWNMILHFFCMLCRILFLTTNNPVWLYLFWLNVPASISYVWMHIAYSINILDRWNEETHNQEQVVKFIEK